MAAKKRLLTKTGRKKTTPKKLEDYSPMVKARIYGQYLRESILKGYLRDLAARPKGNLPILFMIERVLTVIDELRKQLIAVESRYQGK